jgi:hypothetical protein
MEAGIKMEMAAQFPLGKLYEKFWKTDKNGF